MSNNPPLDGRMASFSSVPATLEGDELFWIVQPGNVNLGVLYNVSLSTMAAFIAAFPELNTEVITAGATSLAPYAVAITDTRILFKKTLASASYAVCPPAASMVYGQSVLFKDASGNADANPITVTFSNGETCDGATSFVISNPYGWFYITPSPGGGSWYQS